MSNFLQILPRRLPVALADYVAETGQRDWRRQAVAKRIYAALPAEQQVEAGRICEAIGGNAQQLGSPPRGGTIVAFRGRWSNRK